MNDIEMQDAIVGFGSEIDESTRTAIRAEVAAELRGDRTTLVTPSEAPSRRDWRRPAALLAAAACVGLVAAGIVAFTGRDDGAVTEVSDAQPSAPPSTSAPATVAPATTTPSPPGDLLSRLEGHRWIATAADGRPVLTPQTPWVELSRTGASFLRGNDGCNWFDGDGELQGDLLSVGEVASTAMLCGEDLPVIIPLDGLRLVLDPEAATLRMFDEGGAERLTYTALDALDAADPDSLVAPWWSPTGGTIPAIDIRAGGAAAVGTCELEWSVALGTSRSGRSLLTVTGWPEDPFSCRTGVLDDRTSRLIELLSGGSAEAWLGANGGSLYVGDDELVLHLVRLIDEAPPDDPATVDMLERWPSRPDATPSLDAVPLFLPGDVIIGATDAVRTEWADGPAGRDEYVQTWIAEPGRVLIATTRVGQNADAQHGVPTDVAGWDTAFFADSVPGIVILMLDDPSGTVTLWARGIDRDAVAAFGGAMARRDGAPGWEQPLDGWPEPVYEGWAMGAAGRIVRWDDGDTMVAELDIFWGVPDLFVPWGSDADVFAIHLDDGRITGIGSLLPDRAAVVWSPAPDVVVRLGLLGTMDDALALARSITTVDAATWAAASRLDESVPDGCDSMFC